jgi:hypothetical protein
MHEVHEDKVIVLGDFNTPTFSTNVYNRSATVLRNFQNSQIVNFGQYNSILDTSQRILDLVFSNFNCEVLKSNFQLVDEDSYHPSLDICFLHQTPKFMNFRVNDGASFFNFKKADFPRLYDTLLQTDWSFLNNLTDVDVACSSFYAKLHEIFNLHVPKRRLINQSRKYPPWFDREIIKTIQMKHRLFRKYKRSKDLGHYNEFKGYRSKCKLLISTSYKKYMLSIECKLSKDPKRFWGYIHQKKGRSRIPGTMHFDDLTLSSPQDIVDAFSSFFNQVYLASDPEYTKRVVDTNFHNIISITQIFEEEIISSLKSFKTSMTAGLDGIPSFLLRDCAQIFVTPLFSIFNLIIKSSTFPTVWKQARVSPIFKKGDLSNIEHFRPISIICNFSKILESILYKRIYAGVKNYISPHQHGFVERRSTLTNLAYFSQYVSEAIDSKYQVDVLYTDFQKAFDQIDHFILLRKLEQFGFDNSLLALFQSYLLDRRHYVTYQNFVSKSFTPTSGVPQGSNLGPLLFLLFINDMVNVITCEKLLFADDLKLFIRIESDSDFNLLQNNLDAVVEWSSRNRLSLNTAKCFVSSYSRIRSVKEHTYIIDQHRLERVYKFKDLGVTFDTELNFNDHLNNIVSKALKTYGFIFRNCKDFSNPKTLLLLYTSLIRSQLEYCSLIWYPIYITNINELEKVQRKFLKLLSFQLDGVYPIRNYDNNMLLGRFKLKSLYTRRVNAVVSFLYKLVHHKIDCSFLLSKISFHVPRMNSRNYTTFYIPSYRTNVLLKSPIILMCNNFNRFATRCDIHFDSLKTILDAVEYRLLSLKS